MLFLDGSDEKPSDYISDRNSRETEDNLKRLNTEGQTIGGYVIHIGYDMVKTAENESGNEEPHKENLRERASFEFLSDQYGVADEDSTEKAHNDEADKAVVQLHLSHTLQTLCDLSLKSGKMGYGCNQKSPDGISNPGTEPIDRFVFPRRCRQRTYPCKQHIIEIKNKENTRCKK